MTLDSNADSNDLVSLQSLEDDEVIILLLQLRECMDSSSLEALSLAFHEFTNGSIGKTEYNSKVAKLCPPAATFLWNRLVRSVFYEDYKHEQSLASSSHAISDEEEDGEEEEEGSTKKRKGGGGVSHQKKKKKKKLKKEEEGAESRVRNEWTPQEDRIFLEGLKKYSLNFREIAQLLPNRSRSQIRTHYRYLAKSLDDHTLGSSTPTRNSYHTSILNEDESTKRSKTRGRPPRGRPEPSPSSLLLEIKETIEALESARYRFKRKKL